MIEQAHYPPAPAPRNDADLTAIPTYIIDPPTYSGAIPAEAQPARTFAPREDRLTRILLIGRLSAATGDHLCRARNISANGMNVECDARLIRGDRVRIELRNLAVVEGKVAWNDGTRIGIHFDASIDVESFLRPSDDGTGLTPRAPRIAADAAATLWHDGRTMSARLHNLSQSGCCLIGDVQGATDSVVRITIAGLPPRQATLRWATADRAGYAFHTIFSFADIVAWQRAQADRAAATG